MKLKNYISEILKCVDKDLDVGVTFELGLEPNMDVNPESKNRVKFSCRKNKTPKPLANPLVNRNIQCVEEDF